VVAVRNASEAIETFDAHHTDIALIIADDEFVRRPRRAADGEAGGAELLRDAAVSLAPALQSELSELMPGLRPELLPEIKRIDARVPVVVMTDAANLPHDRYHTSHAIDIAGVLSKPLQAHDVSAVLALSSPLSSTGLGSPVPDWQFPVPVPAPAPLAVIRTIEETSAPRFARRRVRPTRSQRLIATAAATLVGLALTTWLEVRGGAAPQLPEPAPPPSVEVRAPQTHDIRQAISPASLPAKRVQTVRRPATAGATATPARRPVAPQRKSRVAGGIRRAADGTRRADVRRPTTMAARPARDARPAPAPVKRVIAFVGRAPRLCAKPFAALWQRVQRTRDDSGTKSKREGDDVNVERDERNVSTADADIDTPGVP
jgi:hypothetical protein